MTAIEPNAALQGSTSLDLEPRTSPADAESSLGTQTGREADPSGPSFGSATVADRYASDLTTADLLGQTDGTAQREALAPGAPAAAPIPLPFRTTSGRYRSQAVGFQLELRIDVDGRRPLRRLSGDYFNISGGTVSYFGSWTVDAVTVTTNATHVKIVGTARTTWTTTFTVATVTVPRTPIFQPAGPATIRWSTPSGAIGATYVCGWEAGAFRTVELEQDCESSVTPFAQYNTGALPSGGPARTLSIGTAYAEAGVQMVDTGGANIISTPSNHVWNNASLHHAMEAHFSRRQERPQFKVWLLHAQRHEFTTATSTLLGIMFDQQGLQRQGCATFYERIAGNSPVNQRRQLYTNVHELGHCLNLFHSFHKNRMDPPMPNRPGSLSWMNYPSMYDPGGGAPAGDGPFWAAFPFQFDDLELAHLRHGFRNNVIMGGNPFGKGAASQEGEEFAALLSDTTGLKLRISQAAGDMPVLGTPVVLEIDLTVERPQQVHTREQLHPKFGFVQVAINRPRGDVVVHEPTVRHCAEPDLLACDSGTRLPISAYIGYDATVGQVFEDPGTYRIRAVYAAPNGSLVVSNTATIRVAAPRSTQDDRAADLLLNNQTGMAFALQGTDSPYLVQGTDALRTVADEYREHPGAVYARFALGMNAARSFSTVEPDGSVHVREPDLGRADSLLWDAINMSREDGGLDDLTVYQAGAYLAEAHAKAGDTDGAHGVRAEIRQLAQSKNAPESVVHSLDE
ncbi:hypothetical protein ALI22I_30765 [Saccharothrix sp. ALI-22-I]|uniref:hypothetical protein n=1 Tax=Saccharothrix sp. ALI-22-I TaxID=1933778 RepID=UPI00097C6A62|nr:hypothetical protein [Saccharothrix sp. ALI-22-I]ONI84862.1 hypothetical protein ALI22I_30765 [Saccharothrix sp. ALI-22-I]